MTSEIKVQTNNQLFVDNSIQSVADFDAQYQEITFESEALGDYPVGQVLGYDGTTGTYKITDSTEAAGVANAKAILAQSLIQEPVGTRRVMAIIGGEVKADKLVFVGSDDLDTVPGTPDETDTSFRIQLRDYGIIAREFTNLNEFDNS